MGIQSCELDGASFVLTGGTFNPPIFQPAWLAANNLISAEEAKAVELEVIHPELAVFKIAWLSIQVTLDKFQVETTDPAQAVAMRDLVMGIFDLLEHTPFTRMGLNRHMHFKLDKAEDWEEIAKPLAPAEPWADVLGDHPVPTNVSFAGAQDGPAKHLKAEVQPSNRLRPGIYVGTNEHYESEANGSEGAKELLRHLAACWEDSQRRARAVAERVLGLGGIMTDAKPVYALWSEGDTSGGGAILAEDEPHETGRAGHDYFLSSELDAEVPSKLPDGLENRAEGEATGAGSYDNSYRAPTKEVVVRIPRAAAPSSRFRLLQQWEGLVQTIKSDEFVATLRDITDPSNPAEEVTLPVMEVSPGDRSLLVPGAIFYWSMGYRTASYGQVERVSFLRFRRAPRWSKADLKAIDAEAERLGNMLGLDDRSTETA